MSWDKEFWGKEIYLVVRLVRAACARRALRGVIVLSLVVYARGLDHELRHQH